MGSNKSTITRSQSGCNLCGFDRYAVVYNAIEDCAADHIRPDDNAYTITENACSMPARIVRCLRCGFVYASPLPDTRSLLAAYSDMVDAEYVQEEVGRRMAARSTLRGLKQFLRKRGALLDVGCATGFLLDEARADGWSVQGLEPSQWAFNYARETFGLNVTKGVLGAGVFKEDSFDAIVLKDVIEHITDPKEALITVRRFLRPNGILCVNTPNIDSFISALLGARWWGIKQHHLYYFSKKTLKKMLESAGYDVIKVYASGRVFTFGYILDRLKTYNPFIYNILRPFRKIARIKNALFRINLGDQIEVLARKSRKLKYFVNDAQESLATPKKMKTIVVLPAYNAETTLAKTVEDIPRDLVDEIILVDDVSSDNTVEVSRSLGLTTCVHETNKGYGGNQKTCYAKALEHGADIVVMVHPDYQYDPTAIPELIEPIKKGKADAVFGSRMMKGGALEGGMPLWKHNANILLTALENVVLGTYLTEYHSGFRAYSARLLKAIHFEDNTDTFYFDTEIIVQTLLHHFRIEEIPIRTRYFDEASSIKLMPSIVYGVGILKTLVKYWLHTHDIIRFKQFL